MMQVKYPNVKVKLSNQDGNAMAIIVRVRRALKDAKVSEPQIEAFSTEAMSGDYDHLLQTAMKWVDVN